MPFILPKARILPLKSHDDGTLMQGLVSKPALLLIQRETSNLTAYKTFVDHAMHQPLEALKTPGTPSILAEIALELLLQSDPPKNKSEDDTRCKADLGCL